MNSDVYNIHSRQKFKFHLPLSNSSQYKKKQLFWKRGVQQSPTKYCNSDW